MQVDTDGQASTSAQATAQGILDGLLGEVLELLEAEGEGPEQLEGGNDDDEEDAARSEPEEGELDDSGGKEQQANAAEKVDEREDVARRARRDLPQLASFVTYGLVHSWLENNSALSPQRPRECLPSDVYAQTMHRRPQAWTRSATMTSSTRL